MTVFVISKYGERLIPPHLIQQIQMGYPAPIINEHEAARQLARRQSGQQSPAPQQSVQTRERGKLEEKPSGLRYLNKTRIF